MIDKDYYNLVFGDSGVINGIPIKGKTSEEKIEYALAKAHEIRKFEIDLYWRRTIYFWGFIAVLFGALALLLTAENKNAISELAAISISGLGLFISFAWYYLEKGSKAYQSNWEFHIDYLEFPITGHLHKTLIENKKEFFSVSKINKTIIQAIGIFWFVTFIFLIFIWFFSLFNICNFISCEIISFILFFLFVKFTSIYFWLTVVVLVSIASIAMLIHWLPNHVWSSAIPPSKLFSVENKISEETFEIRRRRVPRKVPEKKDDEKKKP